MRSLRAASCGIGVNALAATSVVYIGSLYLQNALGHSAMESALAIIPITSSASSLRSSGRSRSDPRGSS